MSNKHRARKRFGQNFLHDDAVISRLLASLRLQAEDSVVEIGPGLGALTRPLLDQLKHLQVVEIDRDLIARLAALQLPDLSILEGDVLAIDWHQLHTGKALRIVGNLPYNIGTPLLIKLLEVHPLIHDVHVMLQKEVVDRLGAASNTRAYGRLSVLMQSAFEITPLFRVPATAFEPQPKIESAVVRLKTLADAPTTAQIGTLQKTTRLAFANKRKTLRNNLKGYLDDSGFELLGIDPGARAETLSVATFMHLAEHLNTCAKAQGTDVSLIDQTNKQ